MFKVNRVMNEVTEPSGSGTPLQEYSNLPQAESDYHAIAQKVLGEKPEQSTHSEELKVSTEDALAYLKGDSKGKELKKELKNDPVDTEVDEPEVEKAEQSDDLEEILYNGEIKAITKQEAKALMQKGFDYTQKMQKMSEDFKLKESEFTKNFQSFKQKEQEFEQRTVQFQDAIEQKEQFDLAVDVIRDTDPDFYQQLEVKIAEAIRHFNNPMIKRQFDLLKTRQQEIDSKLESYEVNKIRSTWESDLKSTQSQFSDKLSALGIFPDWNGKVKEAYANGASTVQEALMMAHGGEITKAYESKIKLENVKKAVSNKTNPTMSKSANSSQRSSKIDPTKFSYQQLQEYGLKHY